MRNWLKRHFDTRLDLCVVQNSVLDDLIEYNIIMEACNAVEREVDKVLSKFGAINEHADTVLCDLINQIQSLKKDLEEGKRWS